MYLILVQFSTIFYIATTYKKGEIINSLLVKLSKRIKLIRERFDLPVYFEAKILECSNFY